MWVLHEYSISICPVGLMYILTFVAFHMTYTTRQTLPMQAELAAQLLEEEWPDEDEVRAARMAVREEATPVPERAWALRNVASTLALGGPGERARARSLLEKAVTLKEQWLQDVEHPGLPYTSSSMHTTCGKAA